MLKIGELSKQTGLTKRTIDYYTTIGLLKISETSKSGYRFYSQECVEILNLVVFYKEKNLTLEEIKEKIKELKNGEEIKKVQKLEHIFYKMKEVKEELFEYRQMHGEDKEIEKEEEKMIKDIYSIAVSFGKLPLN